MPTPGSSCATPFDARLEVPAEGDLILIWSSREGYERPSANARFGARSSSGRSEVEIDVFGDLFDVPLEGLAEELARAQLTRAAVRAASRSSSTRITPNAPPEVAGAASDAARADPGAFGTL